MIKNITGIAMSGGVDSTATAILQKQKGPVLGFFMKLNQPDYEAQRDRVSQIAEKLDIKLQIIDLTEEFQEYVLKYFSASYFKGLTPNPCVICNKLIKFGLFQQAILRQGVERIATGHYAQIKKTAEGYQLHKGVDPHKDQSYFLSRLTQEQLAHSLFPLGEMHKSAIYDLVEAHGFHDFRGTESQDVCFLEQDNVADFLEKAPEFSASSGNIVMNDGKILGKHKGLHRYTVGQRRGLGISHPVPLYVINLDVKNNNVIVGENEQLFHKTMAIADIHWISQPMPEDLQHASVHIRSTHRGARASVILKEDNRASIIFDEPQRAITPGQFATIYKDTQVLGSGVIL